jgi:CHAT domain-containing protein
LPTRPSLPTALAQVGFAGVIGTLWRVPDAAAGLLVSAFYTTWQEEGCEPAEALRRAQAEIRGLTNGEILERRPELGAPAVARIPAAARSTWGRARRFSDPYRWAAFIHVGA